MRGVVWMTGLSGSGKSTLAVELRDRLRRVGVSSCVLDGDALRAGVSSDLGFSDADRREQVRRAAELGLVLMQNELLAIVALISPRSADRLNARQRVGSRNFIEVFVSAPLEVCEARDVKGLYAAARRGTVAGFTGVSATYEPPKAADLILDTGSASIAESAEKLFDYTVSRFASRVSRQPQMVALSVEALR